MVLHFLLFFLPIATMGFIDMSNDQMLNGHL